MHPYCVDHFTLERYAIQRGRRRLRPFLEVWRYGAPVQAVEIIESKTWRTEANNDELEKLAIVLQICKQNGASPLILHAELAPFLAMRLIRFGIQESRFGGGCQASENLANLAIRAKLMVQITTCVTSERWKEAEVAERCGLNPMRIHDLLRGGVSRFSVEELVNIAISLGQTLRIEMEAP